MSATRTALVAIASLVLGLAGATSSLAQTIQPNPAANSADGAGVGNRITGERVMPGRVGGDRRNRTAQQQRQARQGQQREAAQAAAAQNPEQLKAAAQAQATAATSPCQVTEATLLGVNAEQQPIYEAACATGPGYILISSTPPQAVDCVILAGQADLDRQRDPAADVGLQCKMPFNTDIARVVGAYAQEAGVACTVDQGASIGKSTEGNFIYEVGCNGADGYWIEKAPAGWEKTECLTVVSQNAGCRFTTPVEQAATVKTRLAGSPAAACDVTEARYMGANANGAFYEAKCAAGDGYIARFSTEGAVQQTYPCAEAARIGGGCKLTTVTSAAPAAEAAPAPAPAATPTPSTRR